MSGASGPATAAEHYIPARTGVAFRVNAGDYIQVVDLQGQQPADFWAYYENDLDEYLSAPHTRIGIMRILPRPGECFLTNRRRPWRYEELGHQGWHASCQENLELAMKRAGFGRVVTPQPFNIWTNFHLNPDGTFEIRPPESRKDDYILLRAEMPSVIGISACPQDITQTCAQNPTDLLVRVLR
jgi:uncharacterized protein YcgI (DUF1989 family)